MVVESKVNHIMHRFSYASSPHNAPYNYCSVTDVFRKNVQKFPDKEICIQRGLNGSRRSISNAELDKNATQLAKYLVQNGICKGDYISLFGPNTLEWIIAEFGVIMAGAVSVHTTINVKDGKDIWKSIMALNCKSIILDPGEMNEFRNIITLILENAPTNNKTQIIVIRHIDEFPEYSLTSFSDIMRLTDIPANLPIIFPEDIAVVYSTSGTTGQPKLVPHSHYNCVNLTDAALGTSDNNVILYNDRPFSWMGGFVVTHVCNNQTRVFADSSLGLKGQTTKELWDIMKNENCTHALLLPYFLYDLIHMSQTTADDGWRMNTIITGGEMVDNHYTKILDRFCREFRIIYGSTEANACISSLSLHQGDNLEMGNVGIPLNGYEIKIVSDDGYPTSFGYPGRIQVRSTQIFKGYLQRDDLTKEIITEDGWFDTGDIGLFSSDGNLIFKSRSKDIISRGTRKIFPSTIEEVISEIDNIEVVAVIPVPDPRLHEEVCVCYISDDNVDVSATDVENYCKQKFVKDESFDGLGDMPKYFLPFSMFPLLTTGKINKHKLQEEAVRRINAEVP